MIKRIRMAPLLLMAVLVANRFATKLIASGGIYELILLFAFYLKPRNVYLELSRHPLAMLIVAYAFAVMLIEAFLNGLSFLVARRAAIGFYALTPIILLAFKDELRHFIKRHIITIAFFLLVFAVLNLPNYQPTMAAQVAGALLMAVVIYKRGRIAALFLLVAYLALASGLSSGQSVYRTPIVTILVSTFVFFLLHFRSTNIPKITVLRYLILSIVLFSAMASGMLNKPIGSLLIGISGILESDALKDIALSLGASEGSTRGDAAGTAKTRIIFWASIIDYQTQNIARFIFGSGLQHGFMELTIPDMEFRDKHLIDPHNSFFGIFFKFGLAGLLLYFLFIFGLAVTTVRNSSFKRAAPFFSIAILFSSFEVAMENPHGNLIFWFIFLLPNFFEYDEARRLQDSSNTQSVSLNGTVR